MLLQLLLLQLLLRCFEAQSLACVSSSSALFSTSQPLATLYFLPSFFFSIFHFLHRSVESGNRLPNSILETNSEG